MSAEPHHHGARDLTSSAPGEHQPAAMDSGGQGREGPLGRGDATPGGARGAPDGPARGGLAGLLAAWAALAIVAVVLALPNRGTPGLNYDEAALAGLARDLVTGQVRTEHIPTVVTLPFAGRRLPWVMAGYYGALKSWMFAPAFAAFGTSAAVLRMASLGWALFGLLLFMLFARRLLGTVPAILAGALLGLDPSFFFIVVHDWGPVVPGFVCRFAGLLFAARAWQGRSARDALVAGLAFGLGFWAKIDFAVLLAGCAFAACLAWPGELCTALRERRAQAAALAGGLLLGALPMLLNLRGVLGAMAEFGAGDPRQWIQKPGAIVAMFDGSYFHRLMRVGGNFEHMWEAPAPFRTPYGIVFLLSAIVLAASALRVRPDGSRDRLARFLLLACGSILAALWFVPNASFLHHWTLVYPFPHLAIALAALRLWQAPPEGLVAAEGPRRTARAAAALAVVAVLAGHLYAIGRTERFLTESGGRGLWSDALHRFAAEIDGHPEITVVSLDWGFNEQLAVLTDGPRLLEPVWALQRGETIRLDPDPNTIYLLHPEPYTILPWARSRLLASGAIDPARDDIREYKDRTGDTAFLAIRLR